MGKQKSEVTRIRSGGWRQDCTERRMCCGFWEVPDTHNLTHKRGPTSSGRLTKTGSEKPPMEPQKVQAVVEALLEGRTSGRKGYKLRRKPCGQVWQEGIKESKGQELKDLQKMNNNKSPSLMGTKSQSPTSLQNNTKASSINKLHFIFPTQEVCKPTPIFTNHHKYIR